MQYNILMFSVKILNNINTGILYGTSKHLYLNEKNKIKYFLSIFKLYPLYYVTD